MSRRAISPVTRRRTFADFRRHGFRARHGSVRLTYLALETDTPQVAFAIGRSFGNAVERNRGRRRLRAAFVEALDKKPDPSGAFLLTGNRGLLTVDYQDLVAEVEACIHSACGTAAAGSQPGMPPSDPADQSKISNRATVNR